jgi:prepilin-type N-terminal cleavage/methylation domain-containing protein
VSESRAHPPAGRGFTLLEVLVAVALLGIVVSVLARSAIEGMSYEGDATRRTRASLLADRALWGVEASLELAPPKPLHEESEVGEEFRVTVDVQPIELGPAGLDALLPPVEKSGPGRVASREAPKAPVVGLALFRILVRVAWVEGLRELEVTRSSFAYDASAAAEALAAEPEDSQSPSREPQPSVPPEEEEP